MDSTTTPEDHWQRFRAARDSSLADDHGWLSLTSFQWLPAEAAALDLVPGLWSADAHAATITARAADGLTDLTSALPVDGAIDAVLDDEESLSWVAYGGEDGHRMVVELARRSGRYAVRTRDSGAPTLAAFTGVPTFPYRRDLVVEGRVEEFPEPRDEQIRTAHPEVSGVHRSVGEVAFRLPGAPQEWRLRAAREESGGLALTFHDATNGSTTADWRKVTTSRPGPDGVVLIDFNRAINYPSAFTPFGTCPAPVAGNVVTAPVEAGEKRPQGEHSDAG
ncbi:DUF1684 domain-containing protein [Arthrobacter agilis]|uniref:DUF1684 domain-containing protein n=1 Tax=Arthrobacter agilis TaxID=37921 RepID=UPI002366EEA0|nr:DUF1684 domain-containing protein [Arthrobacter agilis]WDF33106.1 DUF1684 domain-containing protein [Arthrobacter agilis]